MFIRNNVDVVSQNCAQRVGDSSYDYMMSPYYNSVVYNVQWYHILWNVVDVHMI